MATILVTYASMAGATADVAQAVGAELTQHGLLVDVLPIEAVSSLTPYDGVVVGGPMIMGWHRGALGFIRQHRAEWKRRPLAVFVLAMSLTQPTDRTVNGVPIVVDDMLPVPAAIPGRLSFKERYAQLAHYVRPILQAAQPARPASLAVFGGRLEYGRLKWWAVLFAMLIIQARAGDHRNWPAIRAWAAGLPEAFHLSAHPADAQAAVPLPVA
jgi:menaquinone-dependent protoporphyrinogen oxidase